MHRRIILSILAATLAGCAAGEKKETAWVDKRHALTGEVIRLEEKDKVVVVKHEEIPDFMEAMTMGFPVPDAAEWAKLKPGMKIKATVVERKDDFYLTEIQETP
jgi:protein SCO1/2